MRRRIVSWIFQRLSPSAMAVGQAFRATQVHCRQGGSWWYCSMLDGSTQCRRRAILRIRLLGPYCDTTKHSTTM